MPKTNITVFSAEHPMGPDKQPIPVGVAVIQLAARVFQPIDNSPEEVSMGWTVADNEIDTDITAEDITPACQHATFKVMDDDEVYCLGAVFYLKDLEEGHKELNTLKAAARRVVDALDTHGEWDDMKSAIGELAGVLEAQS